MTSARAIDTRIFMPPDKSRGTAFSKPSVHALSTSSTAGAALARDTPAAAAAARHCRTTLAQGISVGSWNTKPMSERPMKPLPRQSSSARCRRRQAGDQPQRRRLAAARRPEQADRNRPPGSSCRRRSSAVTPLENVLPTPRSASSGCPIFGVRLRHQRLGLLEHRAALTSSGRGRRPCSRIAAYRPS